MDKNNNKGQEDSMTFIENRSNYFSKSDCKTILDMRIKHSTVNREDLSDLIVYKDNTSSEWHMILDLIQEKLNPVLKDYYKKSLNLIPKEYIDISHIGFLNDKNGSFTELHYDWEMVVVKDKTIVKPFVVLIYLSDFEEGGNLLFPLQKVTLSPQLGSTIIFPCHFTYPHVSTPVTKGSKHVCRVTYKIDLECYKVDELEI